MKKICWLSLCLCLYAVNATNIKVTPGIIVGGGRIGLHLFESNGKADVLVKSRSESIPSSNGPIYVCTRNNDLEDIITKTPTSKRSDLVFLQNGVLTKFLQDRGLQDNTQALIYYAVAKRGDKPIDGVTDLNPEGLTAVTGKWASDFAARMKQAGLSCHIYDKPTWTRAMLEKHIWICAFMAVGAKYTCTVGEVEKDHNLEVREVIKELARAAAQEVGLTFSHGVEDRLCAYARSVAHFPTALKEFEVHFPSSLHSADTYNNILDGQTRLFTMPFLTSSELESAESGRENKFPPFSAGTHPPAQIMWQLSFSGMSEAEALRLKASSFAEILAYAQHKVDAWFPAVRALLDATMSRDIWATPLYDRDAMPVLRAADQSKTSAACITVLGDACHPMSMFKGQGANQALEDAVLLTKKLTQRADEERRRRSERRKRKRKMEGEVEIDNKIISTVEAEEVVVEDETSLLSPADYLSREAICSVLRTFEREMVARADKKVQASRYAAKHLHSEDVLSERFGISGIDTDVLTDQVLQVLREKNVGAKDEEQLEQNMIRAVHDFSQQQHHEQAS